MPYDERLSDLSCTINHKNFIRIGNQVFMNIILDFSFQHNDFFQKFTLQNYDFFQKINANSRLFPFYS
jgi:hypothetical protein